jgi:putative colanic acid biosynthesis acetyltransferase WcaF
MEMKKVRLSSFKNEWYQPGSKIKILTWYLVNRLLINTYFPCPQFIKQFFLKLFGAKIGTGVVIKPKVNVKYPWFLSIGNNVWIGEKVWIDNLAKVSIGNDVCISQGAMLLTGNHDYKKETFDLVLGEIHLEEGVWIGAMAVVCPNVRCKSHAILSVNSVANKDLEAYTIYQGNPAMAIRNRVLS